jgi:hypothetical protein
MLDPIKERVIPCCTLALVMCFPFRQVFVHGIVPIIVADVIDEIAKSCIIHWDMGGFGVETPLRVASQRPYFHFVSTNAR